MVAGGKGVAPEGAAEDNGHLSAALHPLVAVLLFFERAAGLPCHDHDHAAIRGHRIH